MPTTEELTDRQEAILRHIARHIDRHGFQPSYRELMKTFKIKSPNGMSCHLHALERKGFITVTDRASRAIAFKWKEYI